MSPPAPISGPEPAAPPPHERRAAADADPLTGDAVRARADALLPNELLQPGEIIVLLLKPSTLYIVLACLKSLVLMVLLTAAGVYIARATGDNDIAQQIAVAGSGMALARVAWQFFEWLSRVYVLTDQRIIAVGGVLRVRVFEAPFSQIAQTELFFSLRERIFALGTLVFSTPGTGGRDAAWEMVARPLEVHAKVVETLKRYGR